MIRTPRIVVLQHVACETLGTIEASLHDAGLSFEYHRPFLGVPIPQQIDADGGLIVMGGPMGVYEYDRYPYLREELQLIESALRANRPILGICLGSQLLAHALGARVYPGTRKEIGWHRVYLTSSAADDVLWSGVPNEFTACHWHGDVFDLPSGAELLARSELTAHQAFRYGDRAYGTLFHLETTPPLLQSMIATFADELQAVGISGEQIAAEADQHWPAVRQIGRSVFDSWSMLAASAPRTASVD